MQTEQALLRYRDAAIWPVEEGMGAMLDNQFAAFVAVQKALPALAAAVTAAAARLLGSAGRLVYCGAGASARLAVQDGVELHPTFGWPNERLAYLIAGGVGALVKTSEGAEDDAAKAEAEARALGLTSDDVVISVAASGTTPYTIAIQRVARAAGALTIGLANNANAPLLADAQCPILLATGAEFLAGSTRMTAGTAQKIALNLLSTRVMSELGHIYQGLMVDMMPSNQKLVLRAHRMVAAIAGVPLAEAATAWNTAGRSIKCAVLLLDGHSLPDAEARLVQAKGRLDRARAQTAPNPAI